MSFCTTSALRDGGVYSFFKEKSASGLSNHLGLSAENKPCADKTSVVPRLRQHRKEEKEKKKPVANLQEFLPQ